MLRQFVCMKHPWRSIHSQFPMLILAEVIDWLIDCVCSHLHVSAHVRIPTASLGLAYTGLGRVVWETPWHEPWNAGRQYFSLLELICSWHWSDWGSVTGSWEGHFQRRARDIKPFWEARTKPENFLRRAGRIIKYVFFTFVWEKAFLIFWVRIFWFLWNGMIFFLHGMVDTEVP